MPLMNVLLTGDNALKDIDPEKIVHTLNDITVTALDHGMESGKASIAFLITLDDGRVVVAETSLALFQMAAKMFAARYGWQDGVAGSRV